MTTLIRLSHMHTRRDALQAEIVVPSIDFSWKSDPLATSRAAFAIIGDEVNGRYYDR